MIEATAFGIPIHNIPVLSSLLHHCYLSHCLNVFGRYLNMVFYFFRKRLKVFLLANYHLTDHASRHQNLQMGAKWPSESNFIHLQLFSVRGDIVDFSWLNGGAWNSVHNGLPDHNGITVWNLHVPTVCDQEIHWGWGPNHLWLQITYHPQVPQRGHWF